MPNAVIYARYSSHHQKEESIEGQIRECKAYAKANNLQVIACYIDRAISGKTDARPDFQKMMQDSNSKRFDYVLVYSLDRFARNRYDSAIYKARLKANNIKVLSAKENISDDPTGILMESVLEGMAEYYSAELAQKIKRGMKENALAAKWASGHVPFGYKLTLDKKLIIDPPKAKMVKKIFKAYASGEKIVNLAKMLNDAHYTTALGNRFGQNSFHRFFENEAYIGVFKWNDVRIEGGVPAIVSKEVFQMANERQKSYKYKQKKISGIYALSNKLFCGECLGTMIGISGINRFGTVYRYYACSNKRKHKSKCCITPIPCEFLENVIHEKIIEVLSDTEMLSNVIESMLELSKKNNDTSRLDYLQKEYNQISKQVDNLVNITVETGNLPLPLKKKMNELSEQQLFLEKDIENEKLLLQHLSFDKSKILFFFQRILREKKHLSDIIQGLVNKIIVKKESDTELSIHIFFNFSPIPPTDPTDLTKYDKDKSVSFHIPLDHHAWRVGRGLCPTAFLYAACSKCL